jgi:hypothetical protein
MGRYLEDYQAREGAWAAGKLWATRTTWHTSQGNARVILYLGTMTLCATTLLVLCVIVRVEKNPGPDVEDEKILQVLCSGCDRNLKSGTQCNTCGRWFHNGCCNVKAQVAGRER